MQTGEARADERTLGVCPSCGQTVAAHYAQRDGKIYLGKECPTCGPSEALISSDAPRWLEKRIQCGYQGSAPGVCPLRCLECQHAKPPTLVFLDVTNRCNMNCPICLANIPAMGFLFDPPMGYFEKVFRRVALIKPRPKIQLFGGEPTVRDDLVQIIHLAQSFGLSARVVTNGIRLADEDYCAKLMATGCQLMFSLDGRDPEIYRRLRRNPRAADQKLKALENVRKHRRSKITIMCCTGKGVNDAHISDMIQLCHEGRDYIAALDMIPLTHTWGPEPIEAEDTTLEDVERIFTQAAPGAEFIPAAMLYKVPTIQETFNLRLTFGGAHPNCESVTAMISDGRAYQPVTRYLRRPLIEVAQALAELDRRLGAGLPRSLVARTFGRRGRQFVVGLALLNRLRKDINLSEVFWGKTVSGPLKIAWGLVRGKKMKDLLRRHTRCHGVLRVIVLPFEEPARIDSARLADCPAAFAYEHPVTRQIGLMPVCAWSAYKNDILRQTAQRYGAAQNAQEGQEAAVAPQAV